MVVDGRLAADVGRREGNVHAPGAAGFAAVASFFIPVVVNHSCRAEHRHDEDVVPGNDQSGEDAETGKMGCGWYWLVNVWYGGSLSRHPRSPLDVGNG